MKRGILAVCAGASLLLAVGCATTESGIDAAALRTRAVALFGVVQPAPAQEVGQPAAVLGRALFWDTRLSLDGKTACASCHAREDWSADRRALSINARGQPTTLHSQPMFMAQDQVALRWYGDRKDGANQAERSITGSMGFDNAGQMLGALKANGYESAFRGAFPAAAEPLSTGHYAQALAAYQRTLRTPAPFDDFLRGDTRAIGPKALAGLQKFMDYGCAGCHSGPLVGGTSFQKFGVVKDYWLATGSKTIDAGRFTATKQEADRYVYRVPMLRNVAKTAPYFHDGSVATLDRAVRVMAEVQLGRTLSDEDAADLTAFLDTLTGAQPEHYAPPPTHR
jgi:cytochrome c peroxidase